MKTVTFQTNKGTFTAELYEEEAPATAANFEKLVSSGFYDGIIFHRVIPDFVVQGGDPITKEKGLNHPSVGSGGPGYKIKCETQGNPRTHKVGALSMAHAGKDTGGGRVVIGLSGASRRHPTGEAGRARARRALAPRRRRARTRAGASSSSCSASPARAT